MEFLGRYDAGFVIVTRGPIGEALAYKRRTGNKMTWYSTANSPFGSDEPLTRDDGAAGGSQGNDLRYLTSVRGTPKLSSRFAAPSASQPPAS